MESYEPFSIVVVAFPFTDINQTKKRPALVISSQAHQTINNHISLLMITSAKHSSWESDYAITNLAITGLTAPSIIRQKIFTLDSRLILRYAGKLAEADVAQVTQQIKKHLAC